jgi:hypothetical protein
MSSLVAARSLALQSCQQKQESEREREKGGGALPDKLDTCALCVSLSRCSTFSFFFPAFFGIYSVSGFHALII